VRKKEEDRKMAVEKTIGSSSLVEVIDRILDKGIVVDDYEFSDIEIVEVNGLR
jgi:hypothetical protein